MLEDIGFYTLSDKRAKEASLDSPLARCEILLTDRCNFNCSYCRGSNEHTKGTFSYEQAKKVVDLWAEGDLKNIRFSGGEPTVVPYLLDLCFYTKNKNIERIAVSTNGSADRELYQDLIHAGVNDFSISLDACCASDGDRIAGKDNSWEKVVANIKYLSDRTYVTVGVVLTDDNFDELKDIITYASELGVGDIRIISSAQWNNIEKFKNLFDNEDILTKYPILRYRIENFKNGRNVRGINDKDSHKCSLMLDDMVIANNNHFPCVIAMREGVEPIGTIVGKTIKDIRKERKDWIDSNDTHLCDVCKNNCLDVCVDYNNTADSGLQV